MIPATTVKTRENILRMLAILGINHDLVFSEDPLDNEDRSRVKAFDVNGLVLYQINKSPHFTYGSGANHSLHGYKVDGTWRSTSTPSIQFCKIHARGGQYEYVFEIDIDKHSPDVNLPGHIVELAENIGSRTTNPSSISRMIDKLESEKNA
jgi:hypothetical protein